MELTSLNKISLHTKKKPSGSVKAIYTERADHNEERGRWETGPRRPEEKITLNRQGKIVEFINYFQGSFWRKYTNRFDSSGNLIEADTFHADDSIEYRTFYSYDLPGRRSRFVIHKADGSILESWNYIYDITGDLAEIIVSNPAGSIKKINVYSREGIMTQKTVEYNSENSIKRSSVEIHDFNRRTFERSNYAADGSLDCKSISSYDTDGKETVRYDYVVHGTLDRKLVWAYDPTGNIIKVMKYSARGQLKEECSYIYDFDEVGNWIKKGMQMLILGSEPPQYRLGPVIYRTFTYWPE